jgi:hypothetical protein
MRAKKWQKGQRRRFRGEGAGGNKHPSTEALASGAAPLAKSGRSRCQTAKVSAATSVATAVVAAGERGVMAAPTGSKSSEVVTRAGAHAGAQARSTDRL